MASTIRDVAARAGLSVGTVSKYINGKTVKENTRLAIEEAIKELDFHPNNIAKGLPLNQIFAAIFQYKRTSRIFNKLSNFFVTNPRILRCFFYRQVHFFPYRNSIADIPFCIN